MNVQTDWTSAIAILAAGLIVGALVMFFFRGRKSGATIETDLEGRDLEAKRDALVSQLRALPDDAVDERARLERETAEVLRQIDQRPRVATVAAVETRAPMAMNPTVKGFLWGAGSMAALAGLAYFVMQNATPRTPEPQMTAQAPLDANHPRAPQANDPVIQQLQAEVAKNPDNLTLRNELSQAYLEREDLMAVFEQTKIVLEKDPNNTRAMTFQALVRMAMGESDNAQQMLQKAISLDPQNLDARVTLAWVHAESGRPKQAEAVIADAIKVSPKDKEKLEQVLQQMKTRTEAPPQQAAIPATAPPAAAGRSVRVTLDLDAGAQSRSGVLFVIARGPQGGPPVAVKRLMASAFPMTFDLSSADSMMGQQLPDSFRLEARLDSDGDPLTKPLTDPHASQDGVAPGAVVTLALK